MFGMAYIVAVAAIAWRWRSKAAFAALPALVGTVALFWFDVKHAGAYSSSLWALSGLCLLIYGEYIAGVLYGISGTVYIAFYFGASNGALAIIPIISDGAFFAGLVSGTWPSAVARVFRAGGRFVGWNNLQTSPQNIPSTSSFDRRKT